MKTRAERGARKPENRWPSPETLLVLFGGIIVAILAWKAPEVIIFIVLMVFFVLMA